MTTQPATFFHDTHHINLYSITTETSKKIAQLPLDQQIGLAIERISASRKLFFTNQYDPNSSPFTLLIINQVIASFQNQGKKIKVESQWKINNTLDGKWVSLV